MQKGELGKVTPQQKEKRTEQTTYSIRDMDNTYTTPAACQPFNRENK